MGRGVWESPGNARVYAQPVALYGVMSPLRHKRQVRVREVGLAWDLVKRLRRKLGDDVADPRYVVIEPGV